jgi:drug/metabolite transporter (DMT)-like permease
MTERKVWAAFFLLALAWGTSFMFIKIAVRTLQPVTVVAFRLLIGWLGLLVIVRARGLSLPRKPRTWIHLTVIGVINVAIPFILIVWAESGQSGLDSGVAAILNSTVPLFSILIAGLILQMERITGGRVLGLIVGFGGVVLLLGRDPVMDLGSILPYIAVVTAALCYAAGSVYARHYLQGIKPVLLAAGQLFIADVFAFIFAFALEDFGAQTFSWEAIAALLWLGLFGSCLAYILYFYVLQAWDATRTTLVTYVIPVVGVTAGVLFLGETIDWRVLVGGLLILSGVATVNWRPRRTGRVKLRG